MNTYFTSDLHLGHKNIIKYCERPFKTLDEMNRTIIARWNARVRPEDFVYHIGDFCFRNSSDIRGEGIRKNAQEWIDELNGNITFIKGNHDRNNSLKCRLISGVYEHGNQKFWMCHRPEDANPNYKINLVGHVHNNWEVRIYETHSLINVGVEVWDYYPKTIEELLKRYHRHEVLCKAKNVKNVSLNESAKTNEII